MPKVIFTVTNDLSYDQRMQRISSSLVTAGWEVVLVGRLRPQSKVLPDFTFTTHRLKCWFEQGKWFYLEYNIRLFFWLLRQSTDVYGAIDLDTILPNFWAARLRRKICTYDAHEYFTEVPEVVRRPRIQAIWAAVANWTIPKLRYCYTVGPALARIFSEKYGVPFRVVRNVPVAKLPAETPRRVPPADQPFVLLYQGALNEGRGIEYVLDAMPLLPERVQLWLAGEGDLSQSLRAQAAALGLGDRARFLGFVLPEDLRALTPKADLGCNLLENKGLSYYYSLANKAFDYVQAGIPSLQMAFPEYQALQEEHPCFFLLEHLDAESLAQQIQKILDHPLAYQRRAEACLQAARQWTWENEERTLHEVYEEIAASLKR